jgi:hypothetical protein
MLDISIDAIWRLDVIHTSIESSDLRFVDGWDTVSRRLVSYRF